MITSKTIISNRHGVPTQMIRWYFAGIPITGWIVDYVTSKNRI